MKSDIYEWKQKRKIIVRKGGKWPGGISLFIMQHNQPAGDKNSSQPSEGRDCLTRPQEQSIASRFCGDMQHGCLSSQILGY